jgi:hypothetical protein
LCGGSDGQGSYYERGCNSEAHGHLRRSQRFKLNFRLQINEDRDVDQSISIGKISLPLLKR